MKQSEKKANKRISQSCSELTRVKCSCTVLSEQANKNHVMLGTDSSTTGH